MFIYTAKAVARALYELLAPFGDLFRVQLELTCQLRCRLIFTQRGKRYFGPKCRREFAPRLLR